MIEIGDFKLSQDQIKLVEQVLKSNRLTYGPMTEKFERLWASLHDVKYALFCNSGTSALQVALHALKDQYKWNDWDEVLMPATTFVATMNTIYQNKLWPRLVDVDEYFNIDPDKIEKAIKKKTRAIMVVHLFGQPAQMDKIMKIARKYNLRVIEDSCETVAMTFGGKKVGSFGDVSCFSTYASHIVVTGVGGFACTNNKNLAIRIKGLYNHGRDGVYHSIDDNKKIKMIEHRFNFIHSGYSYRLTELEAAIGIGHLKRLKKEIARRQAIAQYYNQHLSFLYDNLEIPFIHPKATHAFMFYPLVCKNKSIRDDLMKYLEKKGIRTRYLMPLLNQPVTKKILGDVRNLYPHSEELLDTGLLIGCHPLLTMEDTEYVVDMINDFFFDYG